MQVYIDHDAANAYEKLLFVSPTNTAGSWTTDDDVSLVVGAEGAMSELDAATNLATLTNVKAHAHGF